MFRTMPYIRDAPRNDFHDAENVGVGDDVANKAIVTPSRPPLTDLDINVFHPFIGRVHEALHSVSAKTMGIRPTGTLHSCEGCRAARGTRKPIPSQTATRLDEKLGRILVVFLDSRKRGLRVGSDM